MARVRTMLALMLAALTLLGCSQQMTEVTPTMRPSATQAPTLTMVAARPLAPTATLPPTLTPKATQGTPTAAPTLAPDAYAELTMRWLTGVPCRAPCWEGITPGETAYDDAVELLRDKPFLLEEGSEYPERYELAGDPVDSIVVDVPKQVALKDVIAAYGEPSHIVAFMLHGLHGDGVIYVVDIGWQAQGIVLEHGSRSEPEINGELSLDLLQLYAPELYGLGGKAHGAVTVPWEGYNSFSHYCQDHVALTPPLGRSICRP